MNTAPFSTSIKARLLRAAIVIGSLVIPAFVTWLGSEDFKNFVSEQPWIVAIVPLIAAVLTQVAGQLAGMVSKPPTTTG